MNVVFLDYDGVVSSLCWFYDENNKLTFDCDKDIHVDGKRIKVVNNWQAIQWLSLLCKRFDIKIVVTSSWRLMFDFYKESLIYGGLADGIETLGCTEEIRTEDYWHDRGREIKKYLEDHPEIEHYLILDDENIVIEEQKDCFVKCTYGYGFLYPEYEKAVNYL